MIFRKQLRNINNRFWSNDQLKYVLNFINDYSSVINISGWQDMDKEGNTYRSYFKKDIQYYISNLPTDKVKGITSGNDIKLDLMKTLPIELVSKFDIVLNHTVLEHVPDPTFAFTQLANLSKDILIIVVPWKQAFHFIPDQFGDYYRMSPLVIRELYQKNGFEIIYENFMPAYAVDTYLFYVGSKHRSKHQNFPVLFPDLNQLNHAVGSTNFKESFKGLFFRFISWLLRITKKRGV